MPRRTDRPPTAPAGFVYRSGRNLMLNGNLYRFAGFNAFGMTGCATGDPWTRAQLDTYFSGLPPVAMSRTWAFKSYGVDELDVIVERAQAHGQKLILSLANQGADCGEAAKDAAWYQGGFRGAYLSWVREVVTRYKNSPAIGMWEIINEPGHRTTGVTTSMIKAFLDETAAVIKTIDPHHLIESGAMAEFTEGTGTSDNYGTLHSGPNIDVGSLHEYDQDHNDQVLSRHLAPTLSQLYRLNKPFIVGETGIVAGPGCAVTTQQRAAMFKKEFDGYFLSGVSGVLIWTYSPNPRTSDPEDACMHQVRAPDPDPAIAMVGDYTTPATVPAPTGERQLELLSTRQCIEVPDTADGAVAVQSACDATAADQRFTFRPTTGGFYELVAKHTGKCIEVQGQSLTLRALVQQSDCSPPAANQQVRLEPTDNGYYRIVFRHSVQCLTLNTSGQMQQFDCKTPALTSQQWKVK
ncbi:RICIN domain-containing protein [Microbispora sp. KK1-11]|uniref:RICIN domain-containing protein n=1 Tax=Microbispora sp. KK1-11 TaxID=2053005 RepID=UPI00163C1DE5|nr:RICIN domain-containing protein [Microbispora sp. KK1-11]